MQAENIKWLVKKFTDLVSIIKPKRKKNKATPGQKSQQSFFTQEPSVRINNSSRLESLPPEVRRHLLCTLDLPHLKALVRASPTFHQQYQHDRRHVLCRSLEETLGPGIVDAYAVHLLQSGGKDSSQGIIGFMQSTSALRLPLPLTLDQALGMVGFYLRVVKPILGRFAGFMLESLVKESGKNPRSQPQQVTRTEAIRLTRAMYIFQLLCHVIAEKPDLSSQERLVQVFFTIPEPWEIEQIYIFYQFLVPIYNRILDDVQWDLHEDNPRFDDQGRPPTPHGSVDLSNIYNRDLTLTGLIFRGFPLLNTILFEIKDHEHLVSTIQKHMTLCSIIFNATTGVLDEISQTQRRQSQPSGRDLKQEQRAPFPFRGDDDPDGPPLAWTIIWGGTYSNLYGWYIPQEVRRWGCVFWDKATLEAFGAVDILKQQWERCWYEGDPRDDIS